MPQLRDRYASPLDDEMHAYATKDLTRQFGIPASAVRSLVRAGHIHPIKKNGRMIYSFQDLIVLRTVSALRAANIPAQKISRTLKNLRASLPTGLSLSGLSISALGDRIAVREGRALREPDSGQYALALDVLTDGADLHVIDRRNCVTRHSTDCAAEHFAKALALEDKDLNAARAAYEACLAADSHHIEARLNLGRLLHLSGQLLEAEVLYRGAEFSDPLLWFNLAVLLEDLEREPDATMAYRAALGLDPTLADAHFNLARLHERAGSPRDCLRHLLAYRRLVDSRKT